MTRPLPPSEMQRRNRRLGDVIRTLLVCPVCAPTQPHPLGQVRVVHYRRNTVRVECTACQFRFTMFQSDLVDAWERVGGIVDRVAGSIYLRHEQGG